MDDRYIEALKKDYLITVDYYQKSIHEKTEQQIFLESLIARRGIQCQKIADIACGGGSASIHLASLWPTADFTLVDANSDAISIARDNTKNLNTSCFVGDIYDLDLKDDQFDCVVCWQTLSWLDHPEKALLELVRICCPGGRIFISSLFNVEHDVDIYAKVFDHTRSSTRDNDLFSVYNTYSKLTVRKWIENYVRDIDFHPFIIQKDLVQSQRGLGTYTIKTDQMDRLQVSGGILLNWAILEIVK